MNSFEKKERINERSSQQSLPAQTIDKKAKQLDNSTQQTGTGKRAERSPDQSC
jgi:hypothetical protein